MGAACLLGGIVNPHKNKQLVADYCDRNDFDEVLFYTGIRLFRFGPIAERTAGIVDNGSVLRRLELNHIFGGCNQRPDYRSNLIRMLKPAHDFFHAHLDQGRTVCVLTKLLKRAATCDPDEFSLAEMKTVTSRNIVGIIENYDVSGWCDAMKNVHALCLAELRKLEESQ
jgi:hypothetical protein